MELISEHLLVLAAAVSWILVPFTISRLVEQHALNAFSGAHRGYVLQTGQIVLGDMAVNLR